MCLNIFILLHIIPQFFYGKKIFFLFIYFKLKPCTKPALFVFLSYYNFENQTKKQKSAFLKLL